MIDLNQKAKDIFEQNKAMGWWDDMNRCIYQTIQLISTEIAEATEGARKNLMDDHLPHRKMEEVELADVLIRTLDLGGRMGLSVPSKLNQSAIDNVSGQIAESGFTAGRQHFGMNVLLTEFANQLIERDEYETDPSDLNYHYSMLIITILGYGQSKDYDIISAMNEKIEYNKNRADHKRENRNKENGKGF